jgi:hypothetical protein
MTMAHESTPNQRTCPKDLPSGPLVMVRLLAVADPALLVGYRQASERAVEAPGGRRTNDLRIDQVLAGGEKAMQRSAELADPETGSVPETLA